MALNKIADIVVISTQIENFLQKGKSLVQDGKYDEALNLFEKALELYPDDNRLWNQKGVALRSLGRYNEAIECFNKSLELVPKDLDAS
ncbi:MAG: tetratricopeptide repeat protein [Nitrosopumilaceae archaeon]